MQRLIKHHQTVKLFATAATFEHEQSFTIHQKYQKATICPLSTLVYGFS